MTDGFTLVTFPPAPPPPIIAALARVADVSPEQLKGMRGEKRVVEIRWLGMWLARQFGMKCEAIGEMFDRDHSSVSYALQQFELLRMSDEGLREISDRLLRELRG